MKSKSTSYFLKSKEHSLPIVRANTFRSRAIGLLCHRTPPLFGLWLVHCNAIHTWGMAYPIDLIWLDKAQKIVGLQSGAKPWRYFACPTADSVIELPKNYLLHRSVNLNSPLELTCEKSS
ncbi:MAG: DUF192 domain-containing protein [Hahellaceae bacterium]|nr:DUF192 domain-containing protein [Hahellaceae bacterium]